MTNGLLDVRLDPGSLWIHMSAPRELRTTVVVNRMYGDLLEGRRVGFLSNDEGIQPTIKRLVVIHSLHKRHSFPELDYRGLGQNPVSYYRDIHDDFRELENLVFLDDLDSRLQHRHSLDLVVTDRFEQFSKMRTFTRTTGLPLLGTWTLPLSARSSAESRAGYYTPEATPLDVLRGSDLITATYLDSPMFDAKEARWTNIKDRNGCSAFMAIRLDPGPRIVYPIFQQRSARGLPWWDRLNSGVVECHAE